jgi:pyridoxamine 5'-phosphate oxidase
MRGMNVIAWCLGLRGVMQGLSEAELAPEPVDQFARWFGFARRSRIYQANAFSLSTATADGAPSSRMLLLKGFDAAGFSFYTNFESRKAGELSANGRAAMLFFWSELHRQVRIEGRIAKMSPEESARYFHSRLRGSQIGAWASHQSSELASRDSLAARVRELEKQYAGTEIPLPPYWGGYRLKPERFEFWQGRAFRLHDRLCYERRDSEWRKFRLSP